MRWEKEEIKDAIKGMRRVANMMEKIKGDLETIDYEIQEAMPILEDIAKKPKGKK